MRSTNVMAAKALRTYGALALLAAVMLPRVLGSLGLNLGYLSLAKAWMRLSDAPQRTVSYTPPMQIDRQSAQRVQRYFDFALARLPDSHWVQLGRGEVYLRTGNYAAAVDSLAAALDLSGLRSIAFRLGNAQVYAGDQAAGLATWMSAADSPALRIHLANFLFGQSTWENYHPERWDHAIFVLQDTLERPDLRQDQFVAVSVRLAAMLIHVGRLDDAESVLESALAREPSHADALSWLAWTHHARGDQAAAVEAANAALSLRPHWRALYIRGLVRLEQCRLDDAINDFRSGLKLQPTDYQFYWQWSALGDAYWAAGRPDDAIASWQTYLRYEPKSARVLQKLAEAQANGAPPACRTSD